MLNRSRESGHLVLFLILEKRLLFTIMYDVCESVVLRKCFVFVGKMIALLKEQGDWLGEAWMLSQILLDDRILVAVFSLGWGSTSFQ